MPDRPSSLADFAAKHEKRTLRQQLQQAGLLDEVVAGLDAGVQCVTVVKWLTEEKGIATTENAVRHILRASR